jgi:hypothetical protein
LLLWHGELDERLAKEHRWRPSSNQSLVVELHAQLLFLCLEELNLLKELIMQQKLSLLLRLQRQIGGVRTIWLAESGFIPSVGSSTTAIGKSSPGVLIAISSTTATTTTSGRKGRGDNWPGLWRWSLPRPLLFRREFKLSAAACQITI